ncbi:ribonuclease [Ordospora pajunii]|uniref:ribonuclease n=1 Tax=Ordospora pajunii TaxID=3039483 RepID=UPI002952835D|nr:ribonuclease [Ordospora pajunii]KAH9411792.1 ribonuclease [Ordospora pajunii]
MHKNVFFSSFEQDGKFSKEAVVGIDEAGRGSVMGYMVYGALIMPRGFSEAVEFKDSKKLSSSTRARLFECIKEHKEFEYIYYCNHPDYISEQMLSGDKNLNEISFDSILKILDEITKRCKTVSTVYIDALGDCKECAKKLEMLYPYNFVVKEKADATFKVVSGASIVAKVMRDSMMLEFGKDVGSGYPADPDTVKWLNKNINNVFGFPTGVRYSWVTIKRMLGERKSLPLKGSLAGFYANSS